MTPQLGKLIVLVGLAVVALGAFIWLGGGSLLSWFGRLPGDIRIERESFRFYFPLTTMILFSVLLTVIINLLRKLF